MLHHVEQDALRSPLSHEDPTPAGYRKDYLTFQQALGSSNESAHQTL